LSPTLRDNAQKLSFNQTAHLVKLEKEKLAGS